MLLEGLQKGNHQTAKNDDQSDAKSGSVVLPEARWATLSDGVPAGGFRAITRVIMARAASQS
jgi:hypothetical protein